MKIPQEDRPSCGGAKLPPTLSSQTAEMQRNPVARKAAPPSLRNKVQLLTPLRQLRLNALVGLTGRKGGLPCRSLAPINGLPCLCHCVCRLNGGRAARTKSGSGNHILRTGVKNAASPNTSRQERPLSRRSKPAHSTRERVARHYPQQKRRNAHDDAP